MWHEARKQEKKIRGMLVDYRKRAERRQDFYERIKADPTQFLQVHGRKCKIHLDASVATAAENPAIMQVIFIAHREPMPWQGQKDNLIDRFDVRAHLDYIPTVPRTNPEQPDQHDVDDTDERAMNYERYRVLAQNEFLGVVEEKYLHQLYLEEQFGVNAQIEAETKAAASAAKKKSSAGAAIGYTYEETETVLGGSGPGILSGGVGTASVPFAQSLTAIEKASETSATLASSSGPTAARFDECMKDDSDSDLDMDVSIDINKIGTNQAHELNGCGRQYGMKSNDFYSFLTKDADEADALRMAREEEQEKIMFSGRKSRRERRAQRERKVAGRPLSPPSYAAKEELIPRTFVETNDSSRSPSPVNSGKITYITSFGGEEEMQPHGKISFGFTRDMTTLGGIAGTSKAARLRAGTIGVGKEGTSSTLSYADKVKQNLEKLKTQQSKESDRKPPVQYQRVAASGGRGRSSRSSSGSRSSRSRGRSRRRRRTSSSSRSRSRDRSRSKSRRRLRGTAGGRSRSRSRSRSGGRGTGRSTYSRYRRRSKTNSRSRSRSRSRSHSRTRSKASRWSPRRRYPAGGGGPSSSTRRHKTPPRSSSSSSSSTSSRSRSRSRTPAAHRSQASKTKRRSDESDSDGSRTAKKPTAIVKTQEQLPLVVPHTLLGVPPPPPPPPPVVADTSVDEKKPLPTLALIEPEPEVPIKRYYGRRRGDESSSDEASTSGEDTNGDGDHKPTVVPALQPPEPAGGDDSQTGAASTIKSAGDMILQIKQEKLDPLEQPAIGPTVGVGSGSTSLRFGKTVTVGTSAPESKVVIAASSSAGTGGSSKSVNPRDRLKRKMQILLNKQYKADKKAEIEKVERQIQQQQERDDEMRELALKLRRRQRELRHKYGTPESEHSKSHSSEERSSDERDEGGSKQQQQQQPQQHHQASQQHRFGQMQPPGDDGSSSPRRLPLLVPPLTSVIPPKMSIHSRPPPPLPAGGGGAPMGGAGYRNSVIIERKPVLRSASNFGAQSAGDHPSGSYGGDIGRLRRRESPGQGGGSTSSRSYGGGMSSPAMNLRRGVGMAGSSRFVDRNRRRSPPSSRYDRSRSKSRERLGSRDTGQNPGRCGRRTDYGRTRGDYERYQSEYGGSGPEQQQLGGYSRSGGGGGGGSVRGSGSRYRGRRSRSVSRGRRSRSSERPTTRGNGGGSGSGGTTVASSRQSNRSPKPIKKLVDY
uniref:Suppressor of white apricot N-terminal domain-containing protein n=1 Tax=Anopheles christyi TaxID=43041 RepID=A0A182K1G2_9DIPT